MNWIKSQITPNLYEQIQRWKWLQSDKTWHCKAKWQTSCLFRHGLLRLFCAPTQDKKVDQISWCQAETALEVEFPKLSKKPWTWSKWLNLNQNGWNFFLLVYLDTHRPNFLWKCGTSFGGLNFPSIKKKTENGQSDNKIAYSSKTNMEFWFWDGGAWILVIFGGHLFMIKISTKFYVVMHLTNFPHDTLVYQISHC